MRSARKRAWRKSGLCTGSDRGGHCVGTMDSLIIAAKLSVINRQAWLADVIACIVEHWAVKPDDLLARNWRGTDAAVDRTA